MKSLKYIIIAVSIIAFGSSCTTNFEEYNTNPNTPDKWAINPSSMLEEILYKGADGFLDRTKSFNGELMQYTVSGTTLNAYHRYSISNGVASSAWNHLAQWSANADHMYKLAVYKDSLNNKPVYRNSRAVALTMKALYMSNLTDMFGDIPCSEAFKSDDFKYDPSLTDKDLALNFKPKFDTQEEVYTAILKMLEEANKLYIVEASISIPTKDLMYNGDMKKWKKFTNSLHLRLLMRLSNRDTEMGISEKMNTLLSDPLKYPIFESNTDNAALFFSGYTPFSNRYGSSTESDFTSDRKVADNILSLMLTNDDPRLSLYFKQSKSQWKGLVSGEAEAGDTDGIALLNKTSLGSYTSPYAFMKYDEVMFILAEAAKRGMITGGDAVAKTYYEKALYASIEWWNAVETSGKFKVTEEVANKFVKDGPKYNNTLTRIMEQKYIAMFWVGYEAWHDYRRTGYPNLKIGGGTQANNFTLPTRFAYPINTEKTNPVNYADAVKRLQQQYRQGDNMLAPVWWSKTASGK